jgi:predicted AAA+ superfamily ATPase
MVCPLITRKHHLDALRGLLRRYPVVAVLGARQVGKTTLTGDWLRGNAAHGRRFDLEDPRERAQLADPMLALGNLAGVVVLDEIQRSPELFPA